MKFYYQYTSKDGQKVATKCIRVQNSATVENVIEVLVQKFRPDLRMLPNLASYVLYEVHNDNGQEGKTIHTHAAHMCCWIHLLMMFSHVIHAV